MADNKFMLGNDFLVYDASKGPIGFGTDCTLSISAETIDTANKSSGSWGSSMAGQLSWTMSSSNLYTEDASGDVSTNCSYDDILTYMISRTPVNISVKKVAGYDPSTGAPTNPTEKYKGQAFITSLELNASNNDVASFSVEFQGCGPLTKA